MNQGHLKLLLIEDEESIAKPLMKLMGMRGLNMTWVKDGLEGLEWLSENSAPDCVLVDIMMPRMNGWEFRESQKGNPSISDIPTLFFSADNHSSREAEERGEHFVAKPIDLDELESKIKLVLKK